MRYLAFFLTLLMGGYLAAGQLPWAAVVAAVITGLFGLLHIWFRERIKRRRSQSQ